jgi:CheY-like chemotaxis protein
VLVVDDDRDIADVVRLALEDVGVAVAVLDDPGPAAVAAAVERLAPACVLLDAGGGGTGYGTSWDVAAWLHARTPPVPVVMFSADTASTDEATTNATARSRSAGFVAVLPKPFGLDELERVVRAAVGL